MCELSPAVTAAQADLANGVKREWDELSMPTVVHLRAPEQRGKTFVVQQFIELLLGDGADEPDVSIIPGWRTATDWRAARHMVAAPPVDLRRPPSWAWIGVQGRPATPIDVLAPLRQVTQALLDAAQEGELPTVVETNVSPARDEWLNLLTRTVTRLGLEQIPQLGTGLAALSKGRDARQLWQARGDASTSIRSIEVDRTSVDFLGLLLASRLTAALDVQPALPKTLVVIEDSQYLTEVDFRNLDEILQINPDELLSDVGLPPWIVRRFRSLGVPPALPMMLILLESTDAGGEPILGPFGELIERRGNSNSPVTVQVDRWTEESDFNVVLLRDKLPLLTRDESKIVAENLGPELSPSVQQIVVQRSFDTLLNGYQVALLQSHISRVRSMTNPNEDIDAAWAERHLPNHLVAELESRILGLGSAGRAAVAAGALLGHGFAGSSLDELLGKPSKDVLNTACAAGVMHIHHEEGGEPYYLFDDNMSHSYFSNLAVEDTSLCRQVLNGPSLSKARWLLNCAGPSDTPLMDKVGELARQTTWEYRDLAYRSGLTADAAKHRDVWAAGLCLSADIDMVRSQGGDAPAASRLQQLYSLLKQQPEPGESPHGWAIAQRWFVHRSTPGAMTFGALLARAASGQPCEDITRCIPEAHVKAAETVSTFFSRYDGEPLGRFELQLLTRLGPYIRHCNTHVRGKIHDLLLQASLVSLTAVHYLAAELWQDCTDNEQSYILAALEAWGEASEGAAAVRSYALMATRSGGVLTEAASNTLCSALKEQLDDDLFRSFDVNGSFLDGSAPTVYPWYGLPTFAAWALLSGTADPSEELKEVSSAALLRQLDEHPSAAALLQRYFLNSLDGNQKRRLSRTSDLWLSTFLVGHSEQGGLPKLTRPR